MALSTSLKPQDSKTLMTLSDSSGPSARFPIEGYLTGYPLTESGYYVLARTWPAPEMPRPGCVWTHSLLIDFTELATLSSITQLLSLFQRPNAGDFSGYGKELTYKPRHNEDDDCMLLASTAGLLLSALYEEPKARIVITSAKHADEQLVLRLWSQQWPRLKRAFRFCTYSAEDRSTKTVPFDVQVLPPESKAVRSRFVDALDADRYVPRHDDPNWLRDALDDLEFPNRNGLRTFLRQVGGDISGGRDAFVLLCRLHVVLSGDQAKLSQLSESVEQLERQFSPNQGRAARLAIARIAMRNPHLLDDATLEFLLRNLDAVAVDAEESHLSGLGEVLWKSNPKRFLRLYEMHSAASEAIVENTIRELPIENLALHAGDVPVLIPVMLALRPAVVGETTLWSRAGSISRTILEHASHSSTASAAAAFALIGAGRNDLCAESFEILGATVVGQAILESDPYHIDDHWLRTLATVPHSVATLLSQNVHLHRYALVRLALVMEPDALPSQTNEDPWVLAWNSSRGEITSIERTYLFAFMMARALSPILNSAAKILPLVFHPLHSSLSKHEFSQPAWNLLEPRMPWLAFDWDPYSRLREATVQICIDQNVSAAHFFALTPDDDVFEAMVRSIRSTIRGRKYLRGVSKSSTTEKQTRYRRKLMEKFL
jgi:hypothetical protein